MHFVIKNNIVALEEICKSFNVKRLYIFGSASTGTFDEMQSDIDLIVELEKMDPIEKGEALLQLWEQFEQLFGRRVDLLSNPQVKNPYLQKGIDSTRQLVYEA